MESSDLLFDPWHLREWLPLRHKGDVAFVPGRAKGNWEMEGSNKGIQFQGLLVVAAKVFHAHMVSAIVIPGTEGSRRGGTKTGPLVENGYPGKDVWTRELVNLGVPAASIIPTRGEGYHTRSEIDDFIFLAKERGWMRGLVFMNPHETLRVMLSFLASRKENEHAIDLFPVTPRASWDTLVYGSLGAQEMPRAHHILEEFLRVQKYQAAGHLASFDELGAYYNIVVGVPWPRWEETQH